MTSASQNKFTIGGFEINKVRTNNKIVLQFPSACAEKSQATESAKRKSRIKVHQFTPVDDRKAIARAFYTLGRSVRWLAKMAGRSECTIEEILRSAHDDQVGTLRQALAEVSGPGPSGPAAAWPVRRAA